MKSSQDAPDRALARSLAALVALGLVPDAAPALRRTTRAMETALLDAVLGEVAGFREFAQS